MLQSKASPKTLSAAMQNADMGAPLERIAIDIMCPLPESHKGSKYVLIICDFFKWTEALLHDQGERERVLDFHHC